MHNLNKPQCSKLPPHWHCRLDFFFLFFFFFLLSFFTALVSSLFFAEQWILLCGFSFFSYTWLALEMLKTNTPIFFNKRWVKWFSFYFFFNFEPPLCDVLIASHQLNLLGFFHFLSNNFLVFIFQYKEMYSND